ncbi:MAG: TetR/AcrR family transcriptional regulator [Candidatus Omnitrophota bacterium]|nr:TetR/AcrR family transcriptional regulator [Candidatus Omnitrophota bacterium]
MGKRKNSYDNILNAAEAVVLKVGAAHMTLDSVARKAGVSKGGLLYNFPTKEILLKAMVSRLIQCFEEERIKKIAKMKAEPAREIKARILSMLARNRRTDQSAAALLAAIACNPKLVEPIRKDGLKFMAEITTPALGFERKAIILLAAVGLHLQEILQVSCLNDKQRKSVIAELLRLADA